MREQDNEENIVDVEVSAPEWIVRYKGSEEPAYDFMRSWIFDAPWSKNKVRLPTQSIQIRDLRIDGNPVVWKHNAKTDGDELEESFQAFLDGILIEDSDDPMRFTWLIHRGPNPELANFDGARTFQLFNRAALASAENDHRGIADMEGVNLERTKMPATGITGDIGGTGLKDLVTEIRLMNREHTRDMTSLLDYTIKTVTQTLDYAKKLISQHPEALDRQAEREHELARMKLENELQREPGYVQVAGKIAGPAVNGVMALSKTNPELAAKFADVIAAFAPGGSDD